MLARCAARLGPGVRWFSAAADVVDEMIAYSRTNYKANHDQALDILKSGLGFQSTSRGAGRLYLAQAEIEAERSRWPEVSSLCRKAAAAASDCEPASSEEALIVAEVELAAAMMGTRAFLTQHKDAEAFEMAQQCMDVARKSFAATGAEDRRWQGLVLANATAAGVQHAAGEMEAAAESINVVLNLTNHQDQRHALNSNRDSMVALALKQAGAFRLAQGELEEAGQLAARAQAATAAAAGQAVGSLTALASPMLSGEAVADAHMLAAQVEMDQKEWEAAEQDLTKALEAAEALGSGEASGGGAHLRVSLVLLLLGSVYSRTGRVTLAEGLYRECCKTMRLSPGSAEAVAIKEMHPSTGALLAWRNAQLMTALPNRGTEAAGWAKVARELYEDAPLGRALAPETVFGTLDNLQGKGEAGQGVVVDLMARRILPRVPHLPPRPAS